MKWLPRPGFVHWNHPISSALPFWRDEMNPFHSLIPSKPPADQLQNRSWAHDPWWFQSTKQAFHFLGLPLTTDSHSVIVATIYERIINGMLL